MAEIKVHSQGTNAPEALNKVSEQVPSAVYEQLSPTIDVSGIDNEMVQKLAAENEKLKVTYEVCFNYILVKYMFRYSWWAVTNCMVGSEFSEFSGKESRRRGEEIWGVEQASSRGRVKRN